ncbi:inositol phospholipid synthesis and fat-storage-inducing TM-domain-containing protein [Pseudoneurospora amorphoporcata]|uniref:Acyl-coenzyme A diphosphatase SCS3 n=1 Tax=Pseudoneurospora amorphoporcata TaxID=241081 RepID=A0AAN6SHP0_9PEZI|nr:inositol phospholipid synthesis and fat-storage-inducing TM-domain-containing protein [Pseudoneurospora amorphoporcata]
MAASPEVSNGASSSTTRSRQEPQRNKPYYPTPTETVLLAGYPVLLLFGTLFSLLNPSVRASPYDFMSQSHVQDSGAVPSYFARKDNIFNVLFVKRAWFWITVSFFVFVFTHPGYKTTERKLRATVRWGLVTLWWIFVTQWFFGPAIVDRGFRVTGGKCADAQAKVNEQVKADSVPGPVGADVDVAGFKEFVTAAACKAAGGRWTGGHDISGHVFLLVLGSAFLVQEVGWVVARHYWRRNVKDERTVVMHDGAVKSAETDLAADKRWDDHSPEMDEAREVREVREVGGGLWDALGYGGKVALGVVGLCAWMLLMTAIYFHTWFEKLTGFLVALMGLYFTYIVPRFVPALREIVGLPGL